MPLDNNDENWEVPVSPPRRRKVSFNPSMGKSSTKKHESNFGDFNFDGPKPSALEKVKQRFKDINSSPMRHKSVDLTRSIDLTQSVERRSAKRGSRSPKKRMTLADRLSQFKRGNKGSGVIPENPMSVSPEKRKNRKHRFSRSITSKDVG